jgi:hypothetical protein
LDLTEDEMFRKIEETFEPIDWKNLRHPDPAKADLRPVDTYEVLPGIECWSNLYVVINNKCNNIIL